MVHDGSWERGRYAPNIAEHAPNLSTRDQRATRGSMSSINSIGSSEAAGIETRREEGTKETLSALGPRNPQFFASNT